jgi:diguanylate cyclase (GGDEF)-like protein/PAS domain S-box-containing protein
MEHINDPYSQMLDTLPEMLVLLVPPVLPVEETDGQFRITHMNRRACALFPLPEWTAGQAGFRQLFANEDEWTRFLLIFRLWSHMAKQGDWGDFQQQHQALFQERRCLEGAQCGMRFQWKGRAGARIWVELSLGWMPAAADEVPGILCAVHDISHQVLREQRMHERQASFIQAQGLAHLGSWEMSLDGQDMWCSDEFYRIFGLAPQSIVPSMAAFLARVHPEDQARMRAAMSDALAGEGYYELEHRIVQPDGSVRVVCGRGVLERDENGQPAGVRGTLQDTTERRLAEDDLAVASKVFEQAIEGVIVTDRTGAIHSVNRAFTEITGYAAEEVVGRKPSLLRSERHDADFYAAMWQSLLATHHWSGEVWNRRKNGEAYLQHLSINGVLDPGGRVTRYIGVFHDLTQMKRNEENLAFRENHDALTGLVNRSLLNNLLGQSLGFSQRDNLHVAVLMLGLDRFKQVNETLGHSGGDSLLFNMAWRLSASVRETDIVARFGGDTFVIVCPNLHAGSQEAVALTHKLKRALAEPFDIEGHSLFMTASIGVAISPDDGTDSAELLRNAELAMNRAKRQGRDTYEFYAKGMNDTVFRRLTLETDMRRAIENEEFEVFYQPKLSPGQGRIVGMEALVRWQHPEKGMVSPADFIPLAEETGMIVGIGEQVLRQACRQTQLWAEMGHDLTVAVNLSARQFRLKNLVIQLQDIVLGAGLQADRLELEITESAVMTDVEEAIAVLEQMRAAGFKVSMDDFGTGYSSLSYLRRFPINKLKIDQSFVRDMHCSADDAAIVNTIISLARNLKIGVVAEGVELEEQLSILTQQGCDEIQGYFFSRPLPADRFVQFLAGEGAAVSSTVRSAALPASPWTDRAHP